MGHNVEVKVSKEGDDWETDPDFEVPYFLVSPGAPGGHADLLLPPFRTTCRSRSRGGEPRPSRAPDARSTSGGTRTSPLSGLA